MLIHVRNPRMEQATRGTRAFPYPNIAPPKAKRERYMPASPQISLSFHTSGVGPAHRRHMNHEQNMTTLADPAMRPPSRI